MQNYEEFVEKFKPKLTTDDCYTPPLVYDAVADWVAQEYGVDRSRFVRPFYPGGDYQAYEYPDGAIVVDNPPFSISAQIRRFYLAKQIPYFLFAPSLTVFNRIDDCCVIADACIVYENGAVVRTAFVTSLDADAVRTAPELSRRIAQAVEAGKTTKELPKYSYPSEIVTVSKIAALTRVGIDFRLARRDIHHIRVLDSQRAAGKTIYGSGFLISEAKAAELRAAELRVAELRAATQWRLSEREKEIVSGLG